MPVYQPIEYRAVIARIQEKVAAKGIKMGNCLTEKAIIFVRVVLLLYNIPRCSHDIVQVVDLHTGDVVNENLHIHHQPLEVLVAHNLRQQHSVEPSAFNTSKAPVVKRSS